MTEFPAAQGRSLHWPGVNRYRTGRGRGEHRHRKRWGQSSRSHCMGLGTTIFRIASILLRFFRQIPWSTSWTHVRSKYADNIRLYWRAHWGGDIYYTFCQVSREIHELPRYITVVQFFPPRRNTPKIISRNAGQRKTKRHMRQSRRVSRARPMAAPQGTGSTRVTSRVIPRPAWLVEESAVRHESSLRPGDRVNSPT